jgi:hypothetical protein
MVVDCVWFLLILNREQCCFWLGNELLCNFFWFLFETCSDSCFCNKISCCYLKNFLAVPHLLQFIDRLLPAITFLIILFVKVYNFFSFFYCTIFFQKLCWSFFTPLKFPFLYHFNFVKIPPKTDYIHFTHKTF